MPALPLFSLLFFFLQEIWNYLNAAENKHVSLEDIYKQNIPLFFFFVIFCVVSLFFLFCCCQMYMSRREPHPASCRLPRPTDQARPKQTEARRRSKTRAHKRCPSRPGSAGRGLGAHPRSALGARLASESFCLIFFICFYLITGPFLSPEYLAEFWKRNREL